MSIILTYEDIEQYLTEIISGLRTIEIDIGEIYKRANQKVYRYVIQQPSIFDKRIANIKYQETYNLSINNGIRSIKDIHNDLIKKYDLYTDNDIKEEKRLRDQIDAELMIYKKAQHPAYNNQYKERLQKAKNKYYDWIYKKIQFEQNSAEYRAEDARIRYLIYACTLNYYTLEKYWKTFDEFNNYSNAIFNEYVGRRLGVEIKKFIEGFDTEIIRALARSNEWKSIWSIAKEVSAPIFGMKLQSGKSPFEGPVSSWTKDQIQLCNWSILYDNVQNGTEPAPQSVYENDYLFDKYVDQLVKKREKERRESQATVDSHGNQHDDSIIFDPDQKEVLFDEYGELRR